MRSIGMAERALELLLLRVTDPVRKTFGKALSEHGMSMSLYIGVCGTSEKRQATSERRQ
jgi:acyl-CoA dehydrogenase